jgi:two-component system cell cycle response regulator DivK
MHGRRPPRPAGTRILIVEDNELNLKLLRDLLEYQGYTILVASLGRTAIDIARQQRPDLILLDVQLPDISGFDVASELKALERTRSIPIIAVTAFAMPGDRERILASGCDAYVAKPFSIDEVLALIERYVDDGKATNGV